MAKAKSAHATSAASSGGPGQPRTRRALRARYLPGIDAAGFELASVYSQTNLDESLPPPRPSLVKIPGSLAFAPKGSSLFGMA
ncbi:MAG: hypothetical protein WCC90_03305, partial [Methylocella sp.]